MGLMEQVSNLKRGDLLRAAPNIRILSPAGPVFGNQLHSPRLDLQEFYEKVLPQTGRYILFYSQNKSHGFYNTIGELVAATEERIETQGLYFATASYGSEDRRTQANVRSLRAHRIDIDAGDAKFAKHPNDTYQTQPDAISALAAAIKEGLPEPSIVVSSGEGLHAYWALDADVGADAWKPVAMLLNAAGKALGLKIDAGCTADSARVLRPVGTLHKNGKRVEVLKSTGRTYANTALGQLLQALVPDAILAPRQPSGSKGWTINDDILVQPKRADNRNHDIGMIVSECAMLAAFAAGAALTEPEWRRCISVMKFARDGERLAHEWSAKDPRYDRDEAQRKWDRYEAGPARCGASPHCSTCKQQGKITSPIQLGDIPAQAPLKPNPDNPQVLQETMKAGGLQSIMDTDGQLNFVTTSQASGRGVRTCMLASSGAATDAIVAMASAQGKTPSDKALETFKATLRHDARQRREGVQVYLRMAEIDDVVFVDLGPGRIARIDAGGYAMVDDLAAGVPVFRRGMGAGVLPDPEMFDTPRAALLFAIGVFVKQFGLTTPAALIQLVMLLEWHRSKTPHPVGEDVGPAGSGKSTMADFKVSLIDPSGDGGRITVGTTDKDIAAAAQQHYMMSLDNAGRFDKGISDMLCIVSTGGTLVVRLLYENGQTANLKLHRPLNITAVSPVAVAPDLQSRVVRNEMAARHTGYVAESELRNTLDQLRPRMLGALYTLLAGALRELPVIRSGGTWGHRLVDFDQMGEAAVKAAGLRSGTFLAAVGEMRERMARRTASGDLFLIALVAVLRKLASKPTHTVKVSPTAVLRLAPQLSVLEYDGDRIEVTARPAALRVMLPLPSIGWARDNAMPATERGLVDAIRRVQPLLSGIGIQVEELASGSRPLLRFDFNRSATHDE